MAGSQMPWGFKVGAVVVAIMFPPLVVSAVDRTVGAINTYATSLEQVAQTTVPWSPPCDVGAVLDALGLSVVEYQAARGLTVDGVVGPQTAGAACAEVLPLSEGTIP